MHASYTKVTSQATPACTNAGYKGYNTSQLQATPCVIMYAGYKGYKPICYRLQGLHANCKQHNVLCMLVKVTSQLQATTQCIMHAGYKGYTSQLQTTQYVTLFWKTDQIVTFGISRNTNFK